jgi:hypothetical protein
VWITVTSSEEARAASTGGADALVVQGPEAGGHRGTWEDRDDGDVPLLELVEAIAAQESVPLIAAGGIADRARVLAALDAGATAVQVGTAFLLCPEAGTGDAYRSAIAAGGGDRSDARVHRPPRTRVVNAFMRAHDGAPSAYPHIHHLTPPPRTAARSAGDPNGFNLWAGKNVALAAAEPAGRRHRAVTRVARLADERVAVSHSRTLRQPRIVCPTDWKCLCIARPPILPPVGPDDAGIRGRFQMREHICPSRRDDQRPWRSARRAPHTARIPDAAGASPPLHHHAQRRRFTMLDGMLTFLAGDQRFQCETGVNWTFREDQHTSEWKANRARLVVSSHQQGWNTASATRDLRRRPTPPPADAETRSLRKSKERCSNHARSFSGRQLND